MPEGSEALDAEAPEVSEAEELEAASKARLAELMDATGGDNRKRVEQADETEASGQAEPDEGNPEGDPADDPAPGPDLDWAPADFRDDFRRLSPGAVEWLAKERKGLHKGFTEKSQELASLKKQVTQIEQDAANWQTVASNPTYLKALTEAMERVSKNGGREEPFDWTAATAEEIDREIARRAEAAAARLVEDKVLRPRETRDAVIQAVYAYQAEVSEDVPSEVFESACAQAVERLGREAFTPQNAKVLLEPYVQAAAYKAKLERAGEKSKADASRAARASSNPGTGGVSPQRVRATWEVEKRTPTRDELLRDRTLQRLRQMTPNREWSLKALEDLAR